MSVKSLLSRQNKYGRPCAVTAVTIFIFNYLFQKRKKVMSLPCDTFPAVTDIIL